MITEPGGYPAMPTEVKKMKMELKNMQVWVDEEEGTFRRWGDATYEVTIQEFDGFAYIVRLDVTEGHRGQGIGSAVVEAVRRAYGAVVAAPEGEKARKFFEKVGEEAMAGELMGQAIWPLDQGYGVFIVE